MKTPSSTPDLIDTVVDDWRRTRPQTDPDALHIVGRIMWLGKRYEDAATKMLADHDLSFSEFDVIATLRRSGHNHELSPTDLAKRVLLSSGGLTACLRRLEANGLISRHGVPGDRRRLMARLTPKGFDMVESFIDRRFGLAKDALANLSRGQIAEAETILRVLVTRAS